MFALKWMNAPGKPQVYPLTPGSMILGRGQECHIQIKSAGLSKQHLQLQMTGDKVLIKDLGSTNGTFVNGLKVQNQLLQPGDKILLHNLLFEVVEIRAPKSQAEPPRHWPQAAPSHLPGPLPAEAQAAVPIAPVEDKLSFAQYVERFEHYFENVAMPAIYKLTEVFEFRMILASGLALFIVVLTLLSIVPTSYLLESRMEQEGQRRALTLARYLEARNREAVAQNIEGSLDVALPHEQGIKSAWIIAHNDGRALAPVNRAGRFQNAPFVSEAREKDAELAQTLDSNTVAASVPIRFYNPEQGVQITGAHAVVFYDMTSLSEGEGRVLGLFVQILLIALIMGALVFVVLYKVIEYPLRQLNKQLDQALREGGSAIQLDVHYPVASELCSNINSALSRIGQASGPVSQGGATLLATDIESLTEMISTPALAVRGSDETIVTLNASFEAFTGLSPAQAFNQPLDVIIDQALRKNMQDLIEKSRMTGALETDQLEMLGGQRVALSCKAITVGDQISFYLIVIQEAEAS